MIYRVNMTSSELYNMIEENEIDNFKPVNHVISAVKMWNNHIFRPKFVSSKVEHQLKLDGKKFIKIYTNDGYIKCIDDIEFYKTFLKFKNKIPNRKNNLLLKHLYSNLKKITIYDDYLISNLEKALKRIGVDIEPLYFLNSNLTPIEKYYSKKFDFFTGIFIRPKRMKKTLEQYLLELEKKACS